MKTLRCLFSLSLSCFVALTVQAQTFVGDLNVVTGSSSLTVSGNLVNTGLGSTNYVQQGAGSLVQSYTGNMNVVIDFTNSTLQFTNLTTLTANTSGNWQPGVGGGAGSAPANYGVQIAYIFNILTAKAALRGLSFSVTSTPMAFTGPGPFTFTPQTPETFTVLTGNLDYVTAGLAVANGTTSLAGATGTNGSASAGTLTVLGGNQFQVSIPINLLVSNSFTVSSPNDTTANTRFIGTLVATGTLTNISVPEPTTYALVATTFVVAGYLFYRRKNRLEKQANELVPCSLDG